MMTGVRVDPTKLRLSEGSGSGRVDERVRQRFLDKVKVAPSGCWMWTAATNDHGYGQLYYEGRPQKAHRIAWRLFRGLVPDGLFVLHSCDTPGCVNVEHLFLGDAYDNHKDMTRKGRARVGVGSRHGMSKLTETRVRAVLLLLEDGVGVSAIATCLGVSMQAICRVRDGESWRHVERIVSEVCPDTDGPGHGRAA